MNIFFPWISRGLLACLPPVCMMRNKWPMLSVNLRGQACRQLTGKPKRKPRRAIGSQQNHVKPLP